MARTAVDWEKIEVDFRAGVKTLRQIGDEYGVSHVAVLKRAKRDGWLRDTHEKEKTTLPPSDPMDSAGFVYVIYLDDSASERFYKIGMSKHFSARFDAHQCASPFDVCVACAYFVPNMRAEESALHSEFEDRCVRGEWFRLKAGDVRKIAARGALV